MSEYVRKQKFIHNIKIKTGFEPGKRGKLSVKWIDMHCDTLSEITKIKKKNKDSKESLRRNHLCVDTKRLAQTDSAAQFFACYVNAADHTVSSDRMAGKNQRRVRRDDRARWDAAYEAVLNMIETGRREIRSGADILTVEEGGVLNGRLSRLDTLCGQGIRLITLTWNYENCIGYPNSRDRSIMEKGLTDFGIQTVERMNELGMIVDVSHLSDGGFWDCIRYSRYPVAASHSNARSLCRHPRNLSDEMLRALGENGGLAGLNFYSAFLREDGGTAGGRRGTPADIARHAAWMIRKGGEDAVGMGTDFDGFDADSLPEGIRDVRDVELVWEAMRKEGITPRQLDKIACGNVMRIMHEVWK